MPSLLEFLGYALVFQSSPREDRDHIFHRFYFPGILVGPYTEYATYASLIDGSLFSEGQQTTTSGVKRVPHGRKRVAYNRMVSGLMFMGIFVLFGGKYAYETVLTDAWLHKGFLNR